MLLLPYEPLPSNPTPLYPPTPLQGYKNRSVFLKIVENRWNRTGLNLKTTVKKDKNQQNICKKLDQILRLLVKIFFIKSGRLGW
jgi:hypothetical protein